MEAIIEAGVAIFLLCVAKFVVIDLPATVIASIKGKDGAQELKDAESE